jgi:hypothetical protein
VAISRAQDAFLVFGNMHLFQPNGHHPSAVIGRMLFRDGSNEISGVPPTLLVPGQDMGPGQLIADLENHRSVLKDALETAQRHLVIVSPFLTEAAMAADDVDTRIAAAVKRGVQVRVVSDPQLNNKNQAGFQGCVQRLKEAGALVRFGATQGIHSKLLMVDRSWLVIGSFNWLSAVRESGSQWARYESSLRYDGNEAFEMITKSLRDLAELVGGDAGNRLT